VRPAWISAGNDFGFEYAEFGTVDFNALRTTRMQFGLELEQGRRF
jgi:hypothetical protein